MDLPADEYDRVIAGQIQSSNEPSKVVRPQGSRDGWRAGLGLSGTIASAVLLLGLFNARLAAEIEFAGILITDEKTLFYLVDRSAGVASGWVALQQDFAGYTLSGYDAKGDLLTLTKEGNQKEIRLKDSKVEPGRLEISGEVRFGQDLRAEVIRATMIFDQENTFPLKNGLIVHLTPQRLPDGSTRYQMSIDRPDAEGKLQQLRAPFTIVARPDRGFSLFAPTNKRFPASLTTEPEGVSISFKPKLAEN